MRVCQTAAGIETNSLNPISIRKNKGEKEHNSERTEEQNHGQKKKNANKIMITDLKSYRIRKQRVKCF